MKPLFSFLISLTAGIIFASKVLAIDAGTSIEKLQKIQQSATQTGPGGPTILGVFFQVVLFAAAIAVLGWWLHRRLSSAQPKIEKKAGPVQISQIVPINRNQSVVTLKIGGNFVVVGVSPNHMAILHSLPDTEESFSSQLKKSMALTPETLIKKMQAQNSESTPDTDN
jgi:flagellar biogenesis protein FliO